MVYNMDAKEIREKYERLNASFKKVLIYHCGIDTGFFTEYTRMIDAMLYCLEHKIQFRLYSDYANFGFGTKGGWTDYFLPFCPEVHEPFHQKYNLYKSPSWKVIWAETIRKREIGLVAWKLKSVFRHLQGSVYAFKIYKKKVLLTHQIGNYKDASHHFDIPELGICGNYFQAFRILFEMTWHLNADMEKCCGECCAHLSLENEYAACQVRGGDKITEVSLISPECYVEALRKNTDCKNVFVLTDDYSLFVRLQNLAPDLRWYTFCMPQEAGYVNSSFSEMKLSEKKNQMVRFLASFEMLRHASLFIGSITTGPSLFLLKILFPSRALPIDCRKEDMSRIVLLHLKERVKISQAYLQH